MTAVTSKVICSSLDPMNNNPDAIISCHRQQLGSNRMERHTKKGISWNTRILSGPAFQLSFKTMVISRIRQQP